MVGQVAYIIKILLTSGYKGSQLSSVHMSVMQQKVNALILPTCLLLVWMHQTVDKLYPWLHLLKC